MVATVLDICLEVIIRCGIYFAEILIYPEDTEVIAGDTVLLTCVSYQSPITWSQEGVELVNDSMRITVYQEQFMENGLLFYQSILQICSTESSDSGTYSCIADGENSSISFQLTVQSKSLPRNPVKKC